MDPNKFQSVFEKVYDVAVIGGGYSAFAAAITLQKAGKHVLLVNSLPVLLWESSYSFNKHCCFGSSEALNDFLKSCSEKNGHSNDHLVSSVAEILATEKLVTKGVDVLYFAFPLAVRKDEGMVSSLAVATKSGIRQVRAGQWIDCSENALFLTKTGSALPMKAPSACKMFSYFRNSDWNINPFADGTVAASGEAVGSACWFSTAVRQEQCLELTIPSGNDQIQNFFTLLKSLHRSGGKVMQSALMHHTSYMPFPVYDEDPVSFTTDVRNVSWAVPALSGLTGETLAERFRLGEEAAAGLLDRPSCSYSGNPDIRDWENIIDYQTMDTDVCIAGCGTGGAVAAIAAGRQKVKTVCVDLYHFGGGIGTGGGIPSYYYGACGGLQEEIDDRISELQPLFAPQKGQVGRFHPDLKRLVLSQMMEEAGVQFLPETIVYAADTCKGRIQSAQFASASFGKPLNIRSQTYIDATGDGDLACFAGADFTMGRGSDFRPQAYSQIAAYYNQNEQGHTSLSIRNFDAGWVDPCDSESMTSARLSGVLLYYPQMTEEMQPAYIFPLVGLRQGRLIETDYQISMADVIEGKKFEDCVGFAGAWVDNHSRDYQFESDEQMFWFRTCLAKRHHTFSEIPYRCLLPKGLKNVWIGCRALGVSVDAHNSFRMERDMQRIGEVTGLASAIFSKTDAADSRDIDFGLLQKKLAETASLDLNIINRSNRFGNILDDQDFKTNPMACDVQTGLAKLEAGTPGIELWAVYRNPQACQTHLEKALNSTDSKVSWLAASILAMSGDSRAEQRLIQAIQDREYGFQDAVDEDKPESKLRFTVPNWKAAVSLLRCCGTEKTVAALETLTKKDALDFDVKSAILLTLDRLCQRGIIRDLSSIQNILNSVDQDTNAYMTEAAVPGQMSLAAVISDEVPCSQNLKNYVRLVLKESLAWQLHLLTFRIRRHFDQNVEIPEQWKNDPRKYVRTAFEKQQ